MISVCELVDFLSELNKLFTKSRISAHFNMPELPETLKVKLLKEEEESQCYSMESIKELLIEVFRGLGPTIVPIAKQEAAERVLHFDDINQWLEVWQVYGEKTAQETNLKRNQLLEEWGLSLKVYYSTVSKYCAQAEFLKYIDSCMDDVKKNSGDPPREMTPEQYKDCMKASTEYLETKKSDLSILQEIPNPMRRRFIEARVADYAAKIHGFDGRDVENYVAKNSEAFQTDGTLQEAKTKLTNALEEVCADISSSPIDSFLAIAKSQQENDGYFSGDVVERILTHVFESVIDKLMPLSNQERKERRENFQPVSLWLETFEKFKNMGEEISKLERKKSLEEWGLEPAVWDKSVQIHGTQVNKKLEELFLIKKIESVTAPKPVTKDLYIKFLDSQVNYLKDKVKELEELGLPSMFISQRISDYCAIETGLEVEDVVIFANSNQTVMFDPLVTQKLTSINQLMITATASLDANAKPYPPVKDDEPKSESKGEEKPEPKSEEKAEPKAEEKPEAK